MVNLEKLQFFQKRHRQLVLHADNPDMTVFNQCLTEPMLGMIRATEEARRRQPADSSVHTHLGDLVPSMRDLDSDTARQYLRGALKICRTDAASLEDLLRACELLLWQPSTTRLSTSYHQTRQSLDELLLNEKVVSPADVMVHFTQRFSLMGSQDWNTVNLTAALVDCTQAVQQHLGSRDNASYRLLRSALVCSHTGPQIVPLMELLGRDETLRRLRSLAAEPAGRADHGPEPNMALGEDPLSQA